MAVSEFAMTMCGSLSYDAKAGVQLSCRIYENDDFREMTDWEMSLVAIPLPEFELTSASFWSSDENEISPATKYKATNGDFITIRDLINAIAHKENEIPPSDEDMKEFLETGRAYWLGDHVYYEGLEHNAERNTYEMILGS